MTSFSTNEVLQKLKIAWPKVKFSFETGATPLPEDKIIDEMISVCFQASLLTEESRAVRFRLAFLPRVTLKPKSQKGSSRKAPMQRPAKSSVKFDRPRPFSASEIARLAPATDARSSIICVEKAAGGALRIWGLLDEGSGFWHFVHGRTESASFPPNCLTITSHGPGHLTFSRLGIIVLRLREGRLTTRIHSALERGPISEFLERAQTEFHSSVCKRLGRTLFDPPEEGETETDEEYPERFHQQYLLRLLFAIRDSKHGGTLLVIPDGVKPRDDRLEDRVLLKYSCPYNVVRGLLLEACCTHTKYYDLYFKMSDSKMLRAEDFHLLERHKSALESVRRRIDDSVRFLSSLANVDGALVITDQYRLIGFGGEVVAVSQAAKHVKICEDHEGSHYRKVPTEAYGTRHRSAFRFCSSFEDSIAFVFSQDGGIKAIKRVGSNLFVWPEATEGGWGF